MSLSNLLSGTSLSSFGAAHQPKQTPHLQFHGPSSTSILSSSSSTISSTNPHTGQRQPVFDIKTSKHSKPNVTITRILPNGQPTPQPLATATFSSLSGGVTFSLHNGPPIKMHTDHLSMNGAKSFSVPQYGGATFTWKASDSGKHELYDGQRVKLASFASMTMSLSGEPRLDIWVPGDDFFVEMVVCSGVAVLKAEEKEVKQVMRILGDVS